jgi:hypothetical protein
MKRNVGLKSFRERVLGRLSTVLMLSAVTGMLGCDSRYFKDAGIYKMESTQVGVRFRNLPRFMGGGVSSRLMHPGQMVVVMPWDTVYRFTTSVQEVSWGPGRLHPDYISTRARDGNEVAVSVTVRYQLATEVEALRNMVENVSTNDAGVQDIVGVVVRADIRHYLNELSTAEFIKPEEKVKTIDRTKAAIQSRLEKYGIKVVSFNLETYKFERIRPDGSVDDSYQDKLDDINRMREETNLERARIATIVEQKKRRYNEVQAQVNRVVQEAEGSKQQAKLRGDSYLVAKKNEAEQILGSGKAEVAGTVERINALDGPGGKAILKLDIARQLQRNQAKFFVLNEGSQGQGLSVRRTDTNEILRQLGIQDATSEPGGNPKKFESRSKSSRTNEQGSETIEPEVSSVSQASGQHGQ